MKRKEFKDWLKLDKGIPKSLELTERLLKKMEYQSKYHKGIVLNEYELNLLLDYITRKGGEEDC
jgi:hypothetical protein